MQIYNSTVPNTPRERRVSTTSCCFRKPTDTKLTRSIFSMYLTSANPCLAFQFSYHFLIPKLDITSWLSIKFPMCLQWMISGSPPLKIAVLSIWEKNCVLYFVTQDQIKAEHLTYSLYLSTRKDYGSINLSLLAIPIIINLSPFYVANSHNCLTLVYGQQPMLLTWLDSKSSIKSDELATVKNRDVMLKYPLVTLPFDFV